MLQVSKHLEKLQVEKEELAMEKLAALMPQLGAPVRVVALQESQFDVEAAVTILRRFSTEHEESLKSLHKVPGAHACGGCTCKPHVRSGYTDSYTVSACRSAPS